MSSLPTQWAKAEQVKATNESESEEDLCPPSPSIGTSRPGSPPTTSGHLLTNKYFPQKVKSISPPKSLKHKKIHQAQHDGRGRSTCCIRRRCVLEPACQPACQLVSKVLSKKKWGKSPKKNPQEVCAGTSMSTLSQSSL